MAELVGIEPTLFSRYINGRRKPPPDFEARVMKALNLLERAEAAAREARERVLAGEGA